MKEQLEAIRKSALDAVVETRTAVDLEAVRVRYLGKKGELTAVLKQMGKLSPEERPVMGQLANDVRAHRIDSTPATAPIRRSAMPARNGHPTWNSTSSTTASAIATPCATPPWFPNVNSSTPVTPNSTTYATA